MSDPEPTAKPPVVACFCSDFLKPDMRHIYRQISSLRRVKPVVFTQRRQHADRFPFPDKQVRMVPKPASRWFRRFYYRHLRKAPWQAYPGEVRRLLLDLFCAETRVLHIYFGNIAMHWLPLLQAFPRPKVVSFHGADAFVGMDQAGARQTMRAVLAATDLIQTRSRDLADAVVELGCPPDKITLQRTGIPLGKWPAIDRPIPEDGTWQLLQACRLVPKKGLATTLEAFATIHRRLPNARLHLAGDGPLQETLQQQAADLGLPAGSIEFHGFLAEGPLCDLMHRCHLFLHPSETPPDGNREGVPNAMLEAMATGLPVVATRHGGIPEAVTDRADGRLVAERDPGALADAMLELLTNPAALAAMGHRARQAVAEGFASDRQIEKLEQTYLNLITATPDP